MLQISTKTVIILASISFVGAFIMQAWWIRSAYEGELALYNKEKRQFQTDLESGIKQNQNLKEEIKTLLYKHRQEGNIPLQEQVVLLNSIGSVVQQVLKEKQYAIYIENYGIANHTHDRSETNHFAVVAFADKKDLSTDQLEKAGRLCLYCIVQNQNEKHDDFNYELVLLYGKEKTVIYKKMAVLILGSLLFLVFLGLLFRVLLKKYAQEKRLSEAKNDFINNLSHEIQTPVFAVQLANKLIKEKTKEQSGLQSLVAVIEKETQQLKQHAGKILELASLENEQVELHLEAIELNAFIGDKQATLELMLQNRAGKLVTKFEKKQLLTQLDPTHFNNVLVSLTENAIKYNEGVPEVIIETGEKEEMVFMMVKDNGIGIQSQYLPYVFDKFYRVPGKTKNGTIGFGLGLSYVRQIIKLHGGIVEIKSEPGRGTVLIIQLPKTKGHA